MKLAVIGTGYVGMIAGACFADFGNDVVCVDIDEARVAMLRRGEMPLHEPGLQELVLQNVREKRLSFTCSIKEAVAGAEIAILAVGTPPAPDGSADLSQVLAVAAEVGRAATGSIIVVTKSTVPVGTADRVRNILRETCTYPFAAVSNPEFLKEGSAVDDFLRPMRIIVGIGPDSGSPGADVRAQTVMRRLYEPLLRTSDRLLFADARSAEMTKYACNAYLATRISFMNDIAALCERTGADVEMVRRGMGMDTRIGPKFLFAGTGYGGSCFSKDMRSLTQTASEHGMNLSLVAAAQEINERQKLVLFEKMTQHFGGEVKLRGKIIAVWGLAFKPETDDVREAPALALIRRLVEAGAVVRATDPVALENASRQEWGASYFADAYDAARGADALALCTEWRQYRQPNFRRLREVMRGDGVFDGRNIWDGEQVKEAGLSYYGIGRPSR